MVEWYQESAKFAEQLAALVGKCCQKGGCCQKGNCCQNGNCCQLGGSQPPETEPEEDEDIA